MIKIDTVDALGNYLHRDVGVDQVVGFVPTMGALHEGHLSLVKRSCDESDITVVSIFVNPTQFNDPDDLKNYPRDTFRDISLLENILSDKDILFTPEYEDLYSREREFTLDLEGLDNVMEGKHRPGHFKGVIRVVKLLFEAVKPDKAFFGQKDYQQLTIIKLMVEKLNLKIEIVACPILREANGLAMSSRNERLAADIRKKAAIIRSTLASHNIIRSKAEIPHTEEKIINEINSSGEFQVEYFEIVDNVSLTRAAESMEIDAELRYFGCIAVFAGGIRLIDNIEFSFLFIKG